MKERKENFDLQTIRFWDELIVRNDQPKRQSWTDQYLGSSGKGPSLVNTGTVFQSARKNEAFSAPQPLSPKNDRASMKFLEHWIKGICQQAPKDDPLLEPIEVIRNFLKNNPHLESDQCFADMVLLCLKNYINADPDFAGRPFPEKLEHAAELARKFIIFTRVTP